ncbi:20S proteasome subunit beta 1 [Protomyces lactucae-debilis]|uniref:Proteasome subunit beta n=1 Tax=Protomyces lactucae-debilis TaxID=2754530 RepID=A0A1Y2FCA2_PROLT|nr:20S proteasome subunit beta 1 [Protomyces lactucae-debilis]ORY81558.1 20S proteasome subunit beta 1 [Protomyces lactucae-debilis]
MDSSISVDWQALKTGEVSMGTTIAALKYDGGVILAADSRTTTGAYIANRVTDKLTQIHEKIWCCRSGSAADTQAIADILHYYLQMYEAQNGKPPSVKIAANMAAEMCYSNKDNLSAGLIVAGYDEKSKGEVYSIPLGGSLHKQDLALSGSGSSYIYGYCDANFRTGMTEQEAIDFLKQAIAHAMERDGSSGGVIRMATLSARGVERHFFADADIPAMWNAPGPHA